jgi:hypothetical protein
VHINELQVASCDKPSRVLTLVIKILVSPILYFALAIYENLVSRLLSLKISISSSLIYAWITNIRVLPRKRGINLWALSYRWISRQMVPKVFIEKGVVSAHP